MNYANLFLSAVAAALVAGAAVAGTTHDWWPIGVAAIANFGTAVIQHMRHIPTKGPHENFDPPTT